jgi:D-lactate dehydrogenase
MEAPSHKKRPPWLEFIDGNAINMIRQYSESDLPEQAGAMLMIEVDGQHEGLDSAAEKINEDVAVPVTEMPALIAGLDQLSKKYDLPIINFGHAGNGNIHVNLLLDPDEPEQGKKAHTCLDEIFSLVLKLNGTLSGEHGVGLEKRDFVDRELDVNSLELMRAIKRQFDPNGILNPDKMFPLI